MSKKNKKDDNADMNGKKWNKKDIIYMLTIITLLITIFTSIGIAFNYVYEATFFKQIGICNICIEYNWGSVLTNIVKISTIIILSFLVLYVIPDKISRKLPGLLIAMFLLSYISFFVLEYAEISLLQNWLRILLIVICILVVISIICSICRIIMNNTAFVDKIKIITGNVAVSIFLSLSILLLYVCSFNLAGLARADWNGSYSKCLYIDESGNKSSYLIVDAFPGKYIGIDMDSLSTNNRKYRELLSDHVIVEQEKEIIYFGKEHSLFSWALKNDSNR